MIDLGDILTLQFGPLANWTGAHYWNIQDEILGLQQRDLDSKSPISDINPTALYREGENPSGQPTYTPRLVLYDLSGSLGAVSTRGWAYNASEEEETDSTIISTWSAPPDIRRSTRIPKSDFLQRLEEEEEEEEEDLEEEEVDRDENYDADGDGDGYSRVGEPLIPPTPLETAADRLNQKAKAGGARYFTDYLKAPLHPKSHVLLPGKWHGTTDPSLGYACLSEDSSSSSSSYYCSATQIEAMTEPIRYLAEESDGIQGFQCMVDDTSGFGRYAQQVLQEVKDDFGGSGSSSGGKPIMLYAIRPPSLLSAGLTSPDDEPSSSSSRQLLNANNLSLGLSTAMLSELSNLYIPIQLGVKFPWLSSQWQYHDSAYQWSGVVAAALDTVSLPLRLYNSAWTSSLSSSSNGGGGGGGGRNSSSRTGRSVYGPSHTDMWTLSQTLTQQYNTPLTALSMAFPCPVITEKDAQKVAQQTDNRQHNRSTSDGDSDSDSGDDEGRAGGRGSSSTHANSYTNRGPFTSSQTVSLTPGIRRAVSQGRYSEFITLRGVRCLGEAITDVASIAPVVDAALNRERGGRCVQQRLLVAQPLPIPLGFPKVFKSGCLNRYGDHVDGNGDVNGDVESTGVLTRLTGTDDFRPGLEKTLEEFGRSSGSIMGQSMMRSWGMEDCKEEVMERLHSLAGKYDEGDGV